MANSESKITSELDSQIFWQHTGVILETSLRVGVIPLNVPSRHVILTYLLSLYSQRVQKPLQRTLPAVFHTELCLNHGVR